MATLIAELFGFVVILLVLYRYVLPVLKRMVRARQDVIQKQVDEAEEATRMLERAQQRFESAVAQAREEAARIRDDARADAQLIRDELVEQAEREVERIRQRGEEQLAAQREQVVRRMRADLGGLAMRLAEHMVVEILSDDARRVSTIDRALDEIDALPEQRVSAVGAGDQRVVPAGGGVA